MSFVTAVTRRSSNTPAAPEGISTISPITNSLVNLVFLPTPAVVVKSTIPERVFESVRLISAV